MKQKREFIINLCINGFLLALVLVGIILLLITAKNPDITGYLNDYEKKIVDAYLVFFISGIIVSITIIAEIVFSFLPKFTNPSRILSVFSAGALALPLAGIFVSACKNNYLQITLLVFLLLIYLGNIGYQLYLLFNQSKEENKKEETYFSGLNNGS